nr:hypothetical protein [Tanacetum cinerariifolium]
MSPPKPKKTQKPRKPKRKTIKVPQPSGSIDIAADEAVYKKGCDSLVRVTTTTSSLEAEQDSGKITKETSNKPSSQGTSSGDGPRRQDTIGDTSTHTRVISSSDDETLDKEDTSKQGRIDEIDANKDIALVSPHDHNIVQDEGIEDVGEEEVVEVVTTAPTITAESTKTHVEDKGKGKAKLIEEPKMPKKRKHQIRADEELAVKLQAKIHEEERIAKEKAQQVKEVNLAWDDVQAKIKADYEMAQSL